MKIAVLGTGMVGQALARKLASLGHSVIMGSRTADNEAAVGFAKDAGPNASNAAFADAAAASDMVFVAAKGEAVLSVLQSAGAENLSGKTIVDVSNPLDFSNGFPPSLISSLSNTTSLGETIQATFPDARVVKTLNTVNCNVMVEPSRLNEPGDMFICGNDEGAKAEVVLLLNAFGWLAPIDLGDITGARAMEQYLPLWVRLMKPAGTVDFNIKIVR